MFLATSEEIRNMTEFTKSLQSVRLSTCKVNGDFPFLLFYFIGMSY
jgi:hypothetical protein